MYTHQISEPQAVTFAHHPVVVTRRRRVIRYENHDHMTGVELLMNVIWIVFGGFEMALATFVYGILCCLTIVGIPCGFQCFKLARLQLLPFGITIRPGRNSNPACSFLCNVLWFFPALSLVFMHLVWALILTITIIGIPFAAQHFKLARLAVCPFGLELVAIRRRDQILVYEEALPPPPPMNPAAAPFIHEGAPADGHYRQPQPPEQAQTQGSKPGGNGQAPPPYAPSHQRPQQPQGQAPPPFNPYAGGSV
uniref:Inner membrane component domain-containing protein n=1 Tax=Chromera velia CCMP2878 TaxID=1169474 RepID=A0A0G4I3V4_9ALVE|eukprot:Cvel_10765.t1-p1 / transcript=Cvel_10765.t1 / gene=Cvel_10765 / organism=Chromera_velia_CCMP2878 / gene_product=Inner membrane protein YccF, putative / transcript_product=Inner membrane protein YccF, putative / location=Cvel_scaffold657:45866-49055(-) / protein_length=250 / sequence_SO=supercontig / SO=protein_coding / is_pseudo=false